MSKLIDYIILAVAGYGVARFAIWCYKDVKVDKRPEVTEEMVDDAFNRMLEEGNYIFDDD
jgi:hypothetical protein